MSSVDNIEGYFDVLLPAAFIVRRIALAHDAKRCIKRMESHDAVTLSIAAKQMIAEHTDEELAYMLDHNSEEDWKEKPALLIEIVKKLGEKAFVPVELYTV